MQKILDIIGQPKNKGALLELLVEDIFKDIGLYNVKKQNSGSQYGFDVIGYVNGKCWKAECKNLRKESTVDDIAPKLVWHTSGNNIDKFIVVSTNGISNDLNYLLEKKLFPFPIEIWQDEFLEKLIYESPRALERLNLKKEDVTVNHKAQRLIFPKNELTFNVFYAEHSPFSFDYFFSEDERLIKAYSEHDFKLTATVANNLNESVIIQEVLIKTLNYETTTGKRVLRQATQKGIIQPIELKFSPKNYPMGQINVIENKVIEIEAKSTEVLTFKLEKSKPGFYEIMIILNCIRGDKNFLLCSSIFPLHIKSSLDNIVTLYTIQFYDSPVSEILNIDNKKWWKIKKEFPKGMKYLGPTLFDKEYNSETWKVQLLKGKVEKEKGKRVLDVYSRQKPKLLCDLKIPVDEKIDTSLEILCKQMGTTKEVLLNRLRKDLLNQSN